MAKPKVRYEVDPHNRLIITPAGKKSRISKYRKLLDGRFKIGRKNSLTYHVKKSQDSDIPQQIKFSGDLSLDKNHNLVLSLNKWGNQIAGNKLTIKGNIVNIKGNKLLFTVVTKTPQKHTKVYVLQLSGSWRVGKHNRLTFNVEREKGPEEIVVIKGIWEVNKDGRLVYKYVKRHLKTKESQMHILAFKGRWNITDKFRLSYGLDSGGDIILTGSWKIDKKKGLLLEVEYTGGHIHAIIFGAILRLGKRNKLEARLKNKNGRDLGIELVLSKKILRGCGQAFVRALSSKRELILHAGTGIIW